MSFSQARRDAPAATADAEARRQKRAPKPGQFQAHQATRADFERALNAFKVLPDVDVGGRRLRRSEQRKVSGRVFGAPSGTGPQAATGDLPDQRRLRKPTKLSHSSESNLEDKLGRREFFDIFTWADKYAQLIGRPDVRPHAQQRSLLDGIESHLLLAEKEGDIEDLSTSASDCDGKLESIKESPAVPSLQVRRMLQSLLPARNSLDIPLEMVARLEHLVELADRVESKKRLRSRLVREQTPLSGVSLEPEPLLLEALPTTPEAAESDERPSVQELVQKYEAKPEEDEEEAAAARARRIQQAPMPTLLRRSVEGPKPGLSAGQDEQSTSPVKLSASTNDEACGTPPLMSDQELNSKSNALRRKGFNNLPRKPSQDCWDVLQPVALV